MWVVTAINYCQSEHRKIIIVIWGHAMHIL
jgi:hypothetical protein